METKNSSPTSKKKNTHSSTIPSLTKAASTTETKTELGQFFTMQDPFTLPGFKQWMKLIPDDAIYIEPFAGANNLVRLFNQHYPGREWHCYDIEPADPAVKKQDTLKKFPTIPNHPNVVITNPPYLAKNVASRNGMKHVTATIGAWDNLYKKCLNECLAHAGWVAAIIPESFITSPHLKERLHTVISLNQPMFVDTEVPVCLAMFTPHTNNDFTVWRGKKRLGTWKTLNANVPTQKNKRITFNDPNGKIALLAVDSSTAPTIRFTHGNEVHPNEIKVSSRHRTRIRVDNLEDGTVAALINEANALINNLRTATSDVVLTAFMGLRIDGQYRRRLDFALARALLSQALENIEK